MFIIFIVHNINIMWLDKVIKYKLIKFSFLKVVYCVLSYSALLFPFKKFINIHYVFQQFLNFIS